MATVGIALAGMAARPPAGRSVGPGVSSGLVSSTSGTENVERASPPSPAENTTTDLKTQLESLNRLMREQRSDLSFSIDEGTGKTVVRVVRESTGELIRQIPSEEVLAVAAALRHVVPGSSLGVEAWS